MIDMVTSQPPIDSVEIDIDSESDLESNSESHLEARGSSLYQAERLPKDQGSDSSFTPPDHTLPILSAMESVTASSATISRALMPNSDVIEVTTSERPTGQQPRLSPTELENPPPSD